jgi:tetratricopeptide (TPR) repeat protein
VRRTAALEIRRATALKRAGALLSAIASAERALSLARGDTALQGEAYVVLADLQVQRGHLPLARDAARRAIELAEQSGRLQLQAWALMVAGATHYLASEYESARKTFERARERATAAGDTAHLTHIEGNLGQCWLALGQRGEARAALERAVALARAAKQPHLEASFAVELGKIALVEGRLDDVRRAARAALRIASSREHRLTVFRSEWLLYRLTRRMKPGDPQRQRLARLKDLFRELDQHEGVDEIREFRAEVLHGATAGERGRG